ncbi:ABC transporter ATP-binding protein [archaeon]|jgi:putative ABC transport system ATP-binding protein|nr:ABC transporter ATP-binding protein [archaeon]MBT4646754.1 ABC transporter ATP-binding protein [archaeon]MBT6822047.1 ABC transporter ATP-binding protein [archaeon]MBT7391433.1 ABC transporter ATP-binding protein [archaeon]
MNKYIIKIDNVWKTYTMGEVQVHALRGLNLEIKHGEFLAIKGPSGSGKSTAMNMIGALDVPTKGSVYLEGKDISKFRESNLAQLRGKKIGFIFQQFNLINTLSAIENVMLPMVFLGMPVGERQRRAKKLLSMVGLDKRYGHRPTELSGGQQQRVAISRALAVNPDVILADEPTGNLDSKTGSTVMDFLKKLNRKENKTIIMVTHDDELAKHADRIENIIDGKIIKGGKK